MREISIVENNYKILCICACVYMYVPMHVCVYWGEQSSQFYFYWKTRKRFIQINWKKYSFMPQTHNKAEKYEKHSKYFYSKINKQFRDRNN